MSYPPCPYPCMSVFSIDIIFFKKCMCVCVVSAGKCFALSYCLLLTVEVVVVVMAVVVSVICAGVVSNSSLNAELGSVVVSA